MPTFDSDIFLNQNILMPEKQVWARYKKHVCVIQPYNRRTVHHSTNSSENNLFFSLIALSQVQNAFCCPLA